MPGILEKIKKEAEQLTSEELLKLIDTFIHQLLIKKAENKTNSDLHELYGSGKGIWQDEDAQEYVNKSRENRI